MIGANKENFNINSFAYSVTGEIQNPGYRVLNRDYGNMCYTYCFSPLYNNIGKCSNLKSKMIKQFSLVNNS